MSRQGSWEKRSYELPSARLVQAEREIYKSFGDRVSINSKAESLVKFGKSAPLSTGSLQTVWTFGGNEVYLTDNLITHVSSSSASDNELLRLEGHTVTGVGDDQQFTSVEQSVQLNGRTPVALSIPMARASRSYNDNGQNLLGTVYFYEDTPVTNGVPTDSTKVHLDIPITLDSTFKAATTISNDDYYIITGGFGSVSLKQAASVDFYLEVKAPGRVFRQVAALSASSTSGPWVIELDPAVIIPKNHDVRVRCETGTGGAVVFANFKGYLAEVIGQ